MFRFLILGLTARDGTLTNSRVFSVDQLPALRRPLGVRARYIIIND